MSRKVGVDVGFRHEPLTGASRPAAAIWMRAGQALAMLAETGQRRQEGAAPDERVA